jgi:septum formation protein
MLILASTSTARQQLLRQAGVSFTASPSPLDEEAEKLELRHLSPTSTATALALAKAKSKSAEEVHATVIGADQTLELNGELLHKPKDDSEARQHLQRLRGNTHKLHSAVAVTRADQVLFETTTTSHLTMRNFSNEFLDTYLQNIEPYVNQSVGCYQYESLGIQLFQSIDGDSFSILGLPLLPLLAFLREIGELQT